MEYEFRRGNAKDMKRVDDESVNLIVTSPPYNLGVDYDVYDDDLRTEDYTESLKSAIDECYRILCQDGRLAVVVGLGTGRPMDDVPGIVKDTCESVGFYLRDRFIWNKEESESSSAWGSWRSASNPRQIYTHEEILVFYKSQPGRDEVRGETIPKNEFMKFIKSVWNVKPESGTEHPAPFPPEIPYRLIKLYSYEGDTVIDPFCGTGTTCLVAERLNRNWIGSDISEEYVNMAKERIYNDKETNYVPDNAEEIDETQSIMDVV